MPILRPDGVKVRENCCRVPRVRDGECKNCGYCWKDEENWVEV